MENNILLEHVQNSELVQGAITESVHRFYYDRILSDREKDKLDLIETNASEILSTLWNLNPNWRYIIEKTARRYKSENTKSVCVFNKPKTHPLIEIKLNYSTQQ